MADYYAEGNTEEVAQNLSDPHAILSLVAETDRKILQLRHRREELLAKYQQEMTGIEKHWNEVMNRPEQADYTEPGPSIPRSW